MSEGMESESCSAFSPAEPSVDAYFVNRHNLSAEVYQKIMKICEQLLGVFEEEKQFLMGDVLCTWAIKQQKIFARFRHLAHYFLYYSIIVSRQPPSVVVKCGEAENHRRSRFWFNTEIRVLGGHAFGLEANGDGVQVRCFLITDETAKQLLSNAYHDVSLPFAVLVGPKAEVEAKLFLERSFADLVRRPLSEIPTHASTMELADQMEIKFQAIVETPQKSTDGPSLVQPRAFTQQAKEHLISRLKPSAQGFIQLDNFLKLPVAEEYQLKKNSAEGEWKLVAFFDWFFKLAEIINKYLYSMWHNGLIYGFCSKDEAERLLRSVQRSALLVRFSDIEYAKIKISVKDNAGDTRHHWYDHTDLNGRNLSVELLSNHKFANIELIYPDIDLEVALGGRDEKPMRSLVPRSLAPTDIYFDNQGAATSTF